MNNIVRNSSEILNKARVFEEESIKSIPKEQRPSFHLSSPVGWINDPNGFSKFAKEYHLFINIIHTILNGDQCIGGIVRQRTL